VRSRSKAFAAAIALLFLCLVAQGFRAGLEPQRPTLGAMHDLTRIPLRAFSGSGDA